ncbi:MAG: hypothetical protein IKG40_02445 [Bacilli bacterium]|nr:hypothetical protein [Bacilli bacterium]
MNKISELIDKTYNKVVLKTLKMEVTAENADVDEIVDRYVNEYDENNFETINYDVNFGYDKTLKDYKKIYSKLRPCSTPKNYCQMTVKARGSFKHMSEIAFGTPNTTIKTKKLSDERVKQMKIKEVA